MADLGSCLGERPAQRALPNLTAALPTIGCSQPARRLQEVLRRGEGYAAGVGKLISCTHRLVPRCHDFATSSLAPRSPSVGLRSPSPPTLPPRSSAPPRSIAAVLLVPGSDVPNAPTGRAPSSKADSDRLPTSFPVRS